MFSIKLDGDFDLKKSLGRLSKKDLGSIVDRIGKLGVDMLRQQTPKDTGTTAESWSYKKVKTGYGYELQFLNSNVNRGVNIAMLIQMGHGTGTGGYVKGVDYINPISEQLFSKLVEEILKEVS